MKIYIGHSRDINYANELYKPIKEFGDNSNNTFLLPHEKDANSSNGRDFYNGLDLFIAEVSMPSTGLGIELGWVYDNNIPIVCIYKKGAKVSGAIKSVTNSFFEYETSEDLKVVLESIINEHKNKRYI